MLLDNYYFGIIGKSDTRNLYLGKKEIFDLVQIITIVTFLKFNFTLYVYSSPNIFKFLFMSYGF